MKTIKFSPLDYSDYREYLKDFVALCKATIKSFSHRSFAKDIGWQIGYLIDVTKGRKNLTLTRAFQLAQYQKLNHLETEHLIHLVLKEEVGGIAKDHFQRKMKKEGYDSYKRDTTSDRELIENVELDAIFSLLRWARKQLPIKKIKELLFTFDLSEEKIQKYLSVLQQKNAVRFHKDGSLEILQKQIISDDFLTIPDGRIHINRLYAENFVRYSRAMQGPALFNSGLVELPDSAFPNIAKKILDFRNWIIEMSQETVEAQKSSLGETVIFQLDMNLFNILNNKSIEWK